MTSEVRSPSDVITNPCFSKPSVTMAFAFGVTACGFTKTKAEFLRTAGALAVDAATSAAVFAGPQFLGTASGAFAAGSAASAAGVAGVPGSGLIMGFAGPQFAGFAGSAFLGSASLLADFSGAGAGVAGTFGFMKRKAMDMAPTSEDS